MKNLACEIVVGIIFLCTMNWKTELETAQESNSKIT